MVEHVGVAAKKSGNPGDDKAEDWDDNAREAHGPAAHKEDTPRLKAQPPESRGTEDLLNGVVRVYVEHTRDPGRYYAADMTQCTTATVRHLFMYWGDVKEHCTDLAL